jgi:CPA2 family monovalent cation:H+ antiporter-2
MLVVGRRLIPWLLHWVAHTGSRELFRLAVLTIALTVAFGAAKLFGVSLALGAFFAGMILSESALSQRAAQETLPLRDAFAVLFFVAVGMLFNPFSVIDDPLPLLATLFIIVIGKSAAAFAIVLLFKHPIPTALTISASLAQIGEFSFILAELGVRLELLPTQGRDLVLAGAILSILLNPLLFTLVDRLNGRLAAQARGADPDRADRVSPAAPAPPSHTILVGYGRVGQVVAAGLQASGTPFTVIEAAEPLIERLREARIPAVAGNAAQPEVLAEAGLARADLVILAIPEVFESGQVVEQARAANPAVQIVARAHSDSEVEHLRELGADRVVLGEAEIARGILAELANRAEPGRRRLRAPTTQPVA